MGSMKRKQTLRVGVLLVLLCALGAVFVQRQAVTDWFRLRGYTPPVAVAALAADDTMTPTAEHLFYVNHPDIASGTTFTSHCPKGGEKTVVLGCYVGNDAGIYLYNITDSRLDGVEQVTAAHETLHAAYRRLSTSERAKVDAMLVDYYQHDLTDQRIKDTIAAYKVSEPHDVVNEMHSVFGTEVPNLPAPLEAYYKQYFTDRSKITAYTAGYQQEFTSRQTKITAYDAQLKLLKVQIDSNQAALDTQKSALDTQNQQLQSDRSNGDIAGYNSGVASYNAAVNSYNVLVAATKSQIAQYNDIVQARNAVALEEQQLTQEISSTPQTTK